MKIRALQIALILCVSLLGAQAANAAYVEVGSSSNLASIVERLEERKVLTPQKGKKLLPEKDITQADFAELLLRNTGFQPEDRTINKVIQLNDVEDARPQAIYIYKALELDITEARGEKKSFFPDTSVGRLEALIMAMKLEGIFTPRFFDESKYDFSDVSPKSWFAKYIYKARDLDILKPLRENDFFPFRSLSVGETLQLLDRLHSIKNNGKTAQIIINQSSENLPDIPHFNKIAKIWQNVENDYLYQDRIDKDKIGEAVLKTLVDSLSDPFTSFRPSGPVTKSLEATEQEDESAGMGAQVSIKDGKIVIIAPFKDGPADKAGLKTNDIIVRVNGESLENLTLSEAVKKIKGPKGSELKLTIDRSGNIFDVTIIRDTLPVTSVFFTTTEDNIGYIQIQLFKSNTAEDLEKVINLMNTNNNLQGLILDVRNNPGGILEVAQTVSSFFLETGKTVTAIRDVRGSKTIYKSQPVIKLQNVPVVVLINESSASASEIVALALQKNNRAHILGAKSYGKGTVQKLFMYEDESEFQFTVAEWLGPNDISINGKGVTPDTLVTSESRSPDVQLNQAINLIKSGELKN